MGVVGGQDGELRLHSCPFCHLPLDSQWGFDYKTEGDTYVVGIGCPLCGAFHVREIFSRRNEGELTITLEMKLRESSENKQRRPETTGSMGSTSEEALKAILYGVLGGLTKDAIKAGYSKARKDSDMAFDEALKQVLDSHKMRFCPYCNRAIKVADEFCDRCGRAQI
jgi:hypothetical protein